MKYSKHSTYINTDGTEVPSATTILHILNKPFLVTWANSMGFRRKNVKEILEESSLTGTMVHKIIEAYLMKKMMVFIPVKHVTKELIYRYLDHFFEWKKRHEIEPIFMEKKLVSTRFGGTVDFYGKVDGKYTILDFKTSKRAYSSMFLQLAGYCYMLEQQGLQVDQVAIINVNIDKYKERFISREDLEPYIETFTILVELFHKWHDLNASDGWGSILDK